MEAERNFDVRARAPDVDPSHVMLIWAVVHPEIAPGNRGDAQTATTGRWATTRQIPACISDQRISVVQDRSTKRGIPPCGISIGTQASRRPARPSEWHQQPRQAIWLFIKRQNILFMDLRLEASSPDPQPRCARARAKPSARYRWRLLAVAISNGGSGARPGDATFAVVPCAAAHCATQRIPRSSTHTLCLG